MLDIGGFLTSRDFVTQFAAFIAAVLSALAGLLIGDFFGVM